MANFYEIMDKYNQPKQAGTFTLNQKPDEYEYAYSEDVLIYYGESEIFYYNITRDYFIIETEIEDIPHCQAIIVSKDDYISILDGLILNNPTRYTNAKTFKELVLSDFHSII